MLRHHLCFSFVECRGNVCVPCDANAVIPVPNYAISQSASLVPGVHFGQAIADLFRKARRSAPTVVFFDEIDALAGNRAGGAEGGGTGVSGECTIWSAVGVHVHVCVWINPFEQALCYWWRRILTQLQVL